MFAISLVLVGGGAGSKALAGPVVVEINGTRQTTTYSSGDCITINLDADPGTPGYQPISSPQFIRIYDETRDTNGLPNASIG